MFLLFVAFLLITTPVAAAQPVIVDQLALTATSEGVELIISAAQPLQHRLVQYVNPSKVILELPGAKFASGIAKPVVQAAGLRGLRLSQSASGAKVAIDLEYQVPRSTVSPGPGPGQLSLKVPLYFQEERSTRISPGVYYKQITKGTPSGPLEINLLELDPQKAKISVQTRLAGETTLGRETLSQIASGSGAFAAVNGSYFSGDGTPLGLYIEEGRLITEPILNRTALAITKEGRILIQPFTFASSVGLKGAVYQISGLNRQRYSDELILYTPERGERTRTNSFGYELVIIDGTVIAKYPGDAPIPRSGYVLSGHGQFKDILRGVEIGQKVQVTLATSPEWRDLRIQYALGAGPLLVDRGQVRVTSSQERFQPDVATGRAPRSAVGVTTDGRILAVTVNGRKAGISIGMSLEELAHFLVEQGCDKAVNLDGGGSATMVIRNKPLNMPSDGRERPVSSAVLFFVNTNEESFR